MLDELARLGESDTLEFKKTTASLNEAGKTLCGFLNGKGGKVCIGISQDGKAVGQAVSDKTQQEIAQMLAKFSPAPLIEWTRVPVLYGKDVLVFSATPRKQEAPYVFDGKPYRRVGSVTEIMPQTFYQKLLIEQQHKTNRWENAPAYGYEIEDLDAEEILRTIRLGIAIGRLSENQSEPIPILLDRLRVREEGKLLNSAVVLFGKHYTTHYPQCDLKLARFKGVDKSEFLDQKQLKGNAFHLLEEAMLFLRRHLPVSGKIIPGVLERQDDPLFPLDALREALVNALCHRSYVDPCGSVNVAIFDDRLEVSSYGTLPFDLKPEELKTDHFSRPRNPTIASVFYLRGLIEQWGRGTQKIVALSVKAGHPEPEFFEQAGFFVVRFIAKEYVPPNRVMHDLTDRQKQILLCIETGKKEGVSFSDLKRYIGSPVPERSLQQDCQHLKYLRLVELIGFGRGARWRLIF